MKWHSEIMPLWQSLYRRAYSQSPHESTQDLLLIETFDRTAYYVEIPTFELSDITLLNKKRWDVHTPTIHTNMAMPDQLTCLRRESANPIK